MNIKITGVNVTITDAIRNYVESKAERISRHADNIISLNFVLSVEKSGGAVSHKAEANVHTAGKDMHIEHLEEDMYASIDKLMDKLDRMVLKHKEKQSKKGATPSGRGEFADPEAEADEE